jgi:hypothetical protein
MFNVSIDLSDLIGKLNALTDGDFKRDVADAIATQAVQPELAKEPFRATKKKMMFKSAKQRAFVIAGIKSGAINVPYVRTGKIGISEKRQTTAGVDVIVPAPYSDLVRTKGKQAKYHEGTWDTTDVIADRIQSDTAELIGTAAVLQALEKAGLL